MKINPAFLFERVGNQVVVLESATQTVIAVSDDSAKTLREVLDGVEVSSDAPGMAELINQGIVLPASTSQLSRRSLVVAGGAVGAGSILALGLPAAAAASSPQVTRPNTPELESFVFQGVEYQGDWDYPSGSGGSEDQLITIWIEIENVDDYDPVGTTFLWGFTDRGDDLRPFDGTDFPELFWEVPNGDPLEIPDGARDGDDLTVFVFARVDGVLSLPAEVLLLQD